MNRHTDDCAHCTRHTAVTHTGWRWLCDKCWASELGKALGVRGAPTTPPPTPHRNNNAATR